MEREEDGLERQIYKTQILQPCNLHVCKPVNDFFHIWKNIFIGDIFKDSKCSAEIIPQDVVRSFRNAGDHARIAHACHDAVELQGRFHGLCIFFADLTEQIHRFQHLRII